MKKIFLTSLFILCLALNMHADETKGKITLGIKAGITGYAGDIEQTNLSCYYDLKAGFWFSENLGLDLNYGTGFLHASQKLGKKHKFEQYFKSWFQNYTLLFRYKLFSVRQLNASLITGFTIISIKPSTAMENPFRTWLKANMTK